MIEWESGHYANPKRTQGPGLAPDQGMVSSQEAVCMLKSVVIQNQFKSQARISVSGNIPNLLMSDRVDETKADLPTGLRVRELLKIRDKLFSSYCFCVLYDRICAWK